MQVTDKSGLFWRVSLAERYNRAAKHWRGKISNLGYPAAYQWFINAAITDLDSVSAPLEQNFDKQDKVADRNLKILDAGAGTGEFSQSLLRSYTGAISVDLLDISSRMLLEASSLLSPQVSSIQTYCQNIENFNVTNHYDLVLCAHAIEHCVPATSLLVLKQALKPCGRILLVVSKPHWCSRLIWLRWRHRSYSQQQITSMLTDAGFTEIEVFQFPQGPPARTSIGYSAKLLPKVAPENSNEYRGSG